MKDRIGQFEQISPAFRQLQDYVTTGYSQGDITNNFQRIDQLWNKLTPDQQKQYRQLLLKRKRELNSLLEKAEVTKGDRANCNTALSVVELMKARIDVLQPPQFDTWQED